MDKWFLQRKVKCGTTKDQDETREVTTVCGHLQVLETFHKSSVSGMMAAMQNCSEEKKQSIAMQTRETA